jgi:Spy/CpxP family protein refolding chaperone
MTCSALLPNSRAAESNLARHTPRAEWLVRAKEKLGLTDAQVDKIKTELRAEKDTLKALVSDLHDARVSVREAIQASNATESSVRAASAKVAAAEADLAVERLKLYSRISPILTTDQLEKLKELREHLDAAVDRAIDRIGERISQ